MNPSALSVSTVRVLVIDDSPSFRYAMHTLIDITAGFAYVGDASCGEDGLEIAARLRPDLALIDVRMPGIGGVQAARTIASNGWASAVVLITGQELPDTVPHGAAAEMLPKAQLNPATLRRLWNQHQPRATADSLPASDCHPDDHITP